MVKKYQRSTRPSNFFGGLGYLSVITQWLWTTALLLPMLLENDSFRKLILPEQTTSSEPSNLIFDENSLVMIIIAIIVTSLVLIVTFVILIRLPVALVKTSRKSVDSAVEIIIPVLTHNQPVPKKRRDILSVKIRIYIKLALSILPPIPLLFIKSAAIELDLTTAILISIALAIISLLWFAIQYGLALLLKLPFQKLL
jgi:hypothetical protein